MRQYQRQLILLMCFLLLSKVLSAHTINYQLEQSPIHSVVWYYLKLGFQHIIPLGLDHILFIICLCLLTNKLKIILWQATAFTVAHTITLILTMKGLVMVSSSLIEPIIALSIAFIAIENIFFKELKVWRILLVFFFGLIHGMGFAAALNELGLPRNAFYTSLISFNVGVELAQVSIVLIIFFSIIKTFEQKIWYRLRVVYPISICIACVAFYWTFTRI